MKSFIANIVIAVGLFSLAITAVADQKTLNTAGLRDAVECRPRGGCKNFFAKLEAGGKVKIAYFGGSITAQSGWRVQSREYLQKQFPNAEISEIYAAIGGTGSQLGAFRVDNDVLKHKPDLVFVEFAVNDGNRSEKQIIQGMEGIVRKIWREAPECDICFVYTLADSKHIYPYLAAGKLFRAANCMEEVADHYNVPSIFMGSEVVKMEKAGKLELRAKGGKVTRVSGAELDKDSPLQVNPEGKIPFAPDGVHPYNNTGHRLYTETIIRSLPKLRAAGQAGAHKLSTPLDKGNLENGITVLLDKSMMSGKWEQVAPKIMGRDMSLFFKSLWKAKPGAELNFKFKGSKLVIYDVVGPDCPVIEVTLDGRTVLKRPRFDCYCSYHRPSPLLISQTLNPEKVHQVKVKVLADDFDKKEIFAKYKRNDNIADMTKHPEKYKEKNWYIGALLIDGKLVNDK